MRQGLLIKPRTHRYISQFCSVCVGSSMSSFWGWNYMGVIKPTSHLHGFWRSEFHASYLHSKHLATEPFLLLPKFIVNWKYLFIEIHCFKSCYYLEMTIQISASLVYSSRKTSKHVNGQVKSGCGVRSTQQSWNLESDSVREEVEFLRLEAKGRPWEEIAEPLLCLWGEECILEKIFVWRKMSMKTITQSVNF